MADKYKLKKTIITNNREKEVTVPHAKRFSLEEAQKWLANRKKKIGAGTFKSYEVKESGKLSLSANPPYLVAWEFQETGKKKAKKKAKPKAPKKKAKPKMSVVKGGEEPSYLIEVMVTRGGKVHKGFSGKRKRFTSFDLNKVRQDMKDMVDRSKEEGYRIIRESSNSVSLIKGDWTRRYSIVKYEQPKKRTAKKSALAKKETARRSKKKVVADVKQGSRFRQFEVGKSYLSDKYLNLYSEPYSERYITVIKRTKEKITFTVNGHPNKFNAFIKTDGSVSSEYIIFLESYYFADAPFSPAQK